MGDTIESEGSPGGHRLFVGLTIDADSAKAIRNWAEGAYEELPVRLVEESQIHATLLFYPCVSDVKRDWMASLVRKIEWHGLEASTGETELLGRGALALDLALAASDADRLDDRLVRSSYPQPEGEYQEGLRLEPLGQLALEQSLPEWEPRRRSHRRGHRLRLHLTFARYNKRAEDAIPLHSCPPIAVHLQRIALIESHLEPGGSRYEIIAESS